jgi:hypothetical protein
MNIKSLLGRAVKTAAASAILFASVSHAQVHQQSLFLDDGHGHITTINTATGAAGTYTFPTGLGGTVLTNAGSGSLSLAGNFTTSGVFPLEFDLSGSTTLSLPTSGTLMANPMTTIGDIIYASATGTPATPAALPVNGAADGEVLTLASGLPSWAPAPATGLTSVTVDPTSPLTGAGTAGNPLSIGVADGSHNGYLSSAEYTAFNNKGSGTLSSVDVAIGGMTSNGPLTSNGVITMSGQLAIANGGTGIATNTAYALLAGGTTAGGNLQQVSNVGASPNQVLTYVSGTALPTWQNLPTVVTSVIGSPNQVLVNGLSTPAQTGAITLTLAQSIGQTSTPTFEGLTLTDPLAISSGGTGAAAVTGVNQFFANTTTGSAPAFRAITGADVPVFGASGASHAQGAVPDPGATAGTTRFLREDGQWIVPSGGGSFLPLSASTAQTVANTTNSVVPLEINAASGQTVDIQDWDVNGTKVASISSAGALTSPTHYGGSAAASTLTLVSTSGTGTTDAINFGVGTNGGTTAMTIAHSGLVTANDGLTVTGATNINNTATGSTTNINATAGAAATAIGNTTNAGSLTNMTIGASGPNTGAFTTLSASGNTQLATAAASTTAIGNVAGFGNVTVGNTGTGAGTVTILGGATGSIGIGTGTVAQTVDIANGAAANTVAIGSTTSGATTAINSGGDWSVTGAGALTLGKASSATGTIAFGNSAGAALTTLQGGPAATAESYNMPDTGISGNTLAYTTNASGYPALTTTENYVTTAVTMTNANQYYASGASITLSPGVWLITSETNILYTQNAQNYFSATVGLGTSATTFYTTGETTTRQSALGANAAITISLSKIVSLTTSTTIQTYAASTLAACTIQNTVADNPETTNTATGIHAIRIK